MTSLLHYVNLAVPSDRQAWSHEATPELIEDHLRAVIKLRDKRKDLSRRLKKLYRLQVSADYTLDAPEAFVIKTAGRNSRFVVSVAENELPIR
jgi:hypothetical protein